MRQISRIVLFALATIIACCAVAANRYDRHGAMVGYECDKPVIRLIFAADSAFEGSTYALDAMLERNIRGSFFFTGKFLRDTANTAILQRIISEGHYVGGHSDRHILYADWDYGRSPLVSPDSMIADARHNLAELERLGINSSKATWFVPPYEWVAASQVPILRDSLGLTVINPTPGIQIYRDYTTPDMAEYHSSDSILRQLYAYEQSNSLNGVFLILHLGTHPDRVDKLYYHLPAILDTLSARGYTFERLP